MAGDSYVPWSHTNPDRASRRHEQQVAAIINSLLRGGWIVRTGRDTWELRIVAHPTTGGYFSGRYFSNQYFNGQYFEGASS